MDHLSALPSELKSYIFAMLAVEDVARLSQTSKHFDCHIHAWDADYFDKNSCTYPDKIPLRNSKVVTESYLRKSGLVFIKDIVSLAPSNMSQQSLDLTADVESMLKTCKTSDELHYHFEEALRQAEILILHDTVESGSNITIARVARKRRSQWTNEPLWQYFLRVRLDKLWQQSYPSDFMRWSELAKGAARARMLVEALACSRGSTYEAIPRRLTGRAFFLHKMRQSCIRCSSRTSVQGYFNYRYCLSCVHHLKEVQDRDVMLNLVGIWHCFGNSAEAGMVVEKDSDESCLYSLQDYEAAVVQDHNGGRQNVAKNTEVLNKLRDIFQACYVNEDVPKGLFDLLISHHICRTILQTEASAAQTRLDIATDYVLSACTRLSSLVDRYRVNHVRPDEEVLACEAVALYVKYGAITTPDTRRNHNAAKRERHDSYRLSFCFAWDCLVTQIRLTGDTKLEHVSEQFSVSDAREDIIEHRQGEHHAEHAQAT